MKIFLIGFMGVGKTTVGKRLAAALDLPFLDSDKAIETALGMNISDIFSQHGEEYFRIQEKDYITNCLSTLDHFIMATGGGTPCFFDLMSTMNESGITIFLKASVETLVQRNRGEISSRPLLADKTEANLGEHISTLLQARIACYDQATYTLEINHFTVDTTVSEIIKLVDQASK